MISLMVNGQHVETASENIKLIAFLRDELRLTSVKEGCSEGACGTCMVLVDGKITRACIPTVSKNAGKSIQTVEGLSTREKEVYAHCFATAGAVQCGFCIPGMVMSAKALINENNNPTRDDVKKAIRGNICRCTGYVKIEDAIILAAKFFRENIQVPSADNNGKLGENLYRLDADEKTLGTGLYTDDVIIDGMVYAKALRTKYPRARILKIDTESAKAHPDCIKVITAEDVPGNIKCGHLVKDWDALIAEGGITRYIGDALALAVTTSAQSLDEVLDLINIEYEELTPITSAQMALAEDAPPIHHDGNILSEQQLKRGNADEAIANSKHVVTKHYSLPFTEHAFMEPECAIAMPDGEDGLFLYTGGQSVYDEQREISSLLDIPPEKIRVKSMLVGGGFGGKEDMSVQHHAALAAWIVKMPVKIKFSRQESILIHPKRHAMEIDFTTACNENGIITAVKAEIVADTGAYASLGGPVLQRACTHAGGPYNFQNIDVRGTSVITNNPPAGAFRGFGVPQSCFAMESNLNLLAEMVGISQWEIRYRNAIRPGQELPNGQIADDSTALAECLLAVKETFDKSKLTGIACGFKNSGLGVGVPDIGRCILSIEDGRVHIRSSAACIGQGMATVLTQMVCEALDISSKHIVVEPPDTSRTPDSGTTTASRQTVFSGEAAVIAARELKKDLIENSLQELEGKEYYGEYKPETDPMGSEKPNPISHVAYGYAAQVVELEETGKVKKVTAAYDMGTIVNPIAAEGQIEGGILMGIGYGLTEDFPVKDGYPTVKYGTLGLIRATDGPEIETIIIGAGTQENRPRSLKKCIFNTVVIADPDPQSPRCNVDSGDCGSEPAMTGDKYGMTNGTFSVASNRPPVLAPSTNAPPAYGAKGVGELATIPTAPAIQGAYYKLDGKFRQKLPMDDTYYK